MPFEESLSAPIQPHQVRKFIYAVYKQNHSNKSLLGSPQPMADTCANAIQPGTLRQSERTNVSIRAW